MPAPSVVEEIDGVEDIGPRPVLRCIGLLLDTLALEQLEKALDNCHDNS